jgi:hypothetical protein
MIFKKYFFLLATLFIVLHAYSQDNQKAASLKTVLLTIEKKHNVTFNYIETDVVPIKIIPPQNSLSLIDKIDYLKKQTNLDFENIDNKFINIFKEKISNDVVYGFVYSQDESPIEKATIQNEKGEKTTSKDNGYFEFNFDEGEIITISCLGFETKKIEANYFKNNKYAKIYLVNKTTALDIVKANYFLATGITKKTNSIIEIKPKKLGILPGLIEPDVLQVMQQFPGINSADESVASINVRGGKHDENLFLWNGIKMYQTGHFFGLISAFNPNLAHTISISKNGSSPFYGESVSSVIDISSNPTKIEGNNFSAGINLINADVFSKFNLNKKGYIEIAGRKSITDLFKSPTYKEYYNKAFQNTTITNLNNNQNSNFTNNDEFNFYDITLKYFQKIGNQNTFALDLITINDNLNVLQETNNTGNIISEENNIFQNSLGGNLFFSRNWNTNNFSKISVYGSQYELNAEKSKIQNSVFLKQENKVLDYGVKIENNHIINPKIIFNNGFQFTEVATTNQDQITSPSFSRKIKEVLNVYALILEGKYRDSLSRINLNIGMRTNYISKFKKTLFEPRLQFNYGINKYLNFEVLGEFKSQYAFQIIDFQNDFLGIEKRRWILSNNKNIPIQIGKQISASLFYTKNNWFISLDNFYKKVSGINSSSQGFQNQYEFVKTNGDYTVIGTEILIQKKINHFAGWLSYTYNNNNYKFPELSYPTFPNNFKLENTISWAGIYEKENLKVSLGAKWYTGKPATKPANFEINNNAINPSINYDIPNNTNLNSFFQVNFSSTYKWESTKRIQYKLGFSVLNIFNQSNEINNYYRVNNSSESIEEVKSLALKRTPNISFRIIF